MTTPERLTIYLVRCGEEIKVGRTSQFYTRRVGSGGKSREKPELLFKAEVESSKAVRLEHTFRHMMGKPSSGLEWFKAEPNEATDLLNRLVQAEAEAPSTCDPISAAQCLKARTMLQLTEAELASAIGKAEATVRRFEAGGRVGFATALAIRWQLEARGCRFWGADQVSLIARRFP